VPTAPQASGVIEVPAQDRPDHVHFTPTSASWLNMIERFFRDLTESRIRRGVSKT
jgi:hypothetical protein